MALIFDMDGTMVDNMMTHHRGWRKILADYGLFLTLDEVVSTCHGKNVEMGKPNPEVFYKVADKLGVGYADCLVFEDSPTGARTALNAGMKAIILTTTHPAEEFSDISSVLQCVPDFTRIDILSELEKLRC